MKKVFVFLALMTLCLALGAVPASPVPYRYVQPDGSVLWLTNHGDEFFHWTTTEDGQVVEQASDGFWRPADLSVLEQRRRAARVRRSGENARRLSRMNAPATSTRRFLVVLVQFTDRKFTVNSPTETFGALLNEEGYSRDGATGSVRDFFHDNSSGQFTPVFDVFGPVTVSNNQAYYGGSDPNGGEEKGYEAFYEACQKLDGEIDFSRYDSDGDGAVDAILFYFAGHNQAEGGGADTIWPHEWSFRYVYGNTRRMDGKYLDVYSCASEYRGSSGTTLCGIGTATHEFCHAMGLPDTYDTDYEVNGQAGALYGFSTMCSGCYNNDSRTPASLNCIERNMLGWMDWPTEILRSGYLSIPPIQDNVAYFTRTATDGEYFVYEFRNSSGWDAPLPTGMVVYHIDRSTRQIRMSSGSGGYYNVTAGELWENWGAYNALNANGSHPCFYLVPAADPSSLRFLYGERYMVFPGSSHFRTYTPVDWEESETGYSFSEISLSNGTVRMLVRAPQHDFFISGHVRDEDGKPLSNAEVSVVLYGSESRFSARTDASGAYSVNIGEHTGTFAVTVSCEGYIDQTREVEVEYEDVVLDFVLSNEPPKFPDLGFNYIGFEQETYAPGDILLFELSVTEGQEPESVSWTYDGVVKSVKRVLLEAGEHVLTARLTFADGSIQILERCFEL